jgi:hypothetical protein
MTTDKDITEMNIEENIEDDEMSFSEIFAAVTLNGEVIITIPPEEVERTKTGIKNLKSKQATRFKEDGLVPDPSVLTFVERLSEEYDGMIDLSISLARKSVVKIKKIQIPDDKF